MSNPNLQTFKAPHIIVDGDPLVINGVQMPVFQRIVYTNFNYNEDISDVLGDSLPQGQAAPLPMGNYVPGMGVVGSGNTIGMKVRVLFYKLNADGTRGERIPPTPSLPEYDFEFKANSTTLVDDVTGAYVGSTGEENMEEHTRAASYDSDGNLLLPAGKLYGKKFIKEIEYFDRMGEQATHPGVRHLIRQYITANKGRVQPPTNGVRNFI